MCGICGAIWTAAHNAVSQEQLDRMTDVLEHRGPDDRGTLRLPLSGSLPVESQGVALGHRRLSIIDLSPLGRQPLANEDNSVWVTFNGEIYNFTELRRDLLAHGHQFRTQTDTEVIVHLYEEYGERFADYLSGMFAIGIWDAKNRRFVLARDRMGKKPLFYRFEKNRLLFASELKAILTFQDVPRRIDPLALDGYLTWQYVPFPRTIFEGIAKLPPGHCAVWTAPVRENDDPEFRVFSFWNPNCRERPLFSNVNEWRTELRNRLEIAVQRRLQSDVPLGAFLSGGIDSTIIVGLMRKFATEKVRTFSIGFPQKEYDETEFARRTAERLGTEHHEFQVTPDAQLILPELIAQYDEPFADSSAIPTWYLSQMTRQYVTVALSGDGGDELFCGYDRYKAMKWSDSLDHIPRFARQILAGPVRHLLPNSVRQRSFTRRLRRFLEALNMSPMERYLQWIAYFNRERKNLLYSPEHRAMLQQNYPSYDVLDFLTDAGRRIGNRDRVTTISLTDLFTYLPGDLMTKVDMASMRHSLEVRAPFLDTDVIELAIAMPLHLKLRGKTGKRILRETFAEFLPPELLNRPKTGFGVPLDWWFRGSLNGMLKEVLLDSSANRFGFFDHDYICRLVREHEEKKFDHASRLWALFVFELWSRKALA